MMKIALLLVALVMPLILAAAEPEYRTDHASRSKYTSTYKPPPVYHPQPKKHHQPQKLHCPKPKEHPRTKCYLYSPKYYDTQYVVAQKKVKKIYPPKYDSYGYSTPGYEEWVKKPYCKVETPAYYVHQVDEYKKKGYTTGVGPKYSVESYKNRHHGYNGGICTKHDIEDYCEMGRHGQGKKDKHNGNHTCPPDDKYKRCAADYGKCEKTSKDWHNQYTAAKKDLDECKRGNVYYDSLAESSTSAESNSASTLSIVLIVVGSVMLLVGIMSTLIARRKLRKGAADNAPNAVMVA